MPSDLAARVAVAKIQKHYGIAAHNPADLAEDFDRVLDVKLDGRLKPVAAAPGVAAKAEA